MERVLLSVFAAVALSGCQVQDPFAVFGPPRVPAPKTAQTAPYYPPTSSASKQPPPPASTSSPRLSVSAEGTSPPPTSPTRFAADSADREPIRIVENPSGTRTASAPSRSLTPSGAPIPSQPPSQPPTAPKMPGSGKSSGLFRTDSAVAPASYQPSSPAFTEAAPATGQWRAR